MNSAHWEMKASRHTGNQFWTSSIFKFSHRFLSRIFCSEIITSSTLEQIQSNTAKVADSSSKFMWNQKSPIQRTVAPRSVTHYSITHSSKCNVPDFVSWFHPLCHNGNHLIFKDSVVTLVVAKLLPLTSS